MEKEPKLLTRFFFVMHGITKWNKDDSRPLDNARYEDMNYSEKGLPESEMPSDIDKAQGQIDNPLIKKGRYQALYMGYELARQKEIIPVIYCANQTRCIETAKIIAGVLKVPFVVDERLNARSYGEIAERGLETEKMKNPHKHLDELDLDKAKLILKFLFDPESIGAEKKSTFKKRVKSFFSDESLNTDFPLIVAGSDVEKLLNPFITNIEKGTRLRRGKFARVDFSLKKKATLQENKSL